MSNSSQSSGLDQITELFQKAEEEEFKYNWYNAIEILKEAEKISSETKNKEIEGKIYYRMGEIYYIASDFEKEEEKVLNCFQLSISYFNKAHDVFKELKREEKVNAALGFINLLKYISESESEIGKENILLNSAQSHFEKAKQIYKNSGNIIDSLKMAVFEHRALNLIIGEKSIRIDENTDFKKLALDFRNLTTEITEDILKQPEFSEIYNYYYLISVTEFCIWSIFSLPIEESIRKQYFIEFIDLVGKIIEVIEESKILLLFGAYSVYSFLNTIVGAFTEIDQFDQKKYIKAAQKWLKKAEVLLEKINATTPLTLFYFMRFTNAILLIYIGYFASDFKHVMANLESYHKSLFIHFPRITIIAAIVYAMVILSLGAINPSTPPISRIDFAKRTLNSIELLKKISIANNPDYKMYNLVKSIYSCLSNAILADLIKEKTESFNYLQIATRIFNELSTYNFQKLDKTQVYIFHLNHTSRTGIIMAQNALSQSEKINYYQKALELCIKGKDHIGGFFRFYIENLFFIGEIYYELAILTEDDKLFKESSLAYYDAIEFCKNRGFFNLVGSGFVNLAQIEDRLGNFHSAADNYQKAIDSFNQAILTLTYSKLGKKIEKLNNYLQAWSIIEKAKSYHATEDHNNAQLNYEEASRILNNVREYKFEAPFYSAWAILENAENLSKQNNHEEAAATYLVSKNKFITATETLNAYLKKKKSPEDIKRISDLIEVAKIRESYCEARQQIENSRLESKKGNHLHSAELYNKASSLFENICQQFKIKRERDELTAVFYLCKAWENMERAEVEHKSNLFAIASDLFKKASEIFPESKMKKLSLGNSLFCKALENGVLFDLEALFEQKIDYYKKVKMYLRESAKNYQLGGFKPDATWAMAISTYFDGVWHLIQADNEIDFNKKNQYLVIATNYLNTALKIFENAGYVQKKKEIQNYLEMVRNEKSILASALEIIEKPEVSASSVGISAPTCPVEISSSVNIDEMSQTDLQTESELSWSKRIHFLYVFLPKSGILLHDYSFKSTEEIEPQLVAGGLTGISMLIQEMTRNRTKIKIIEQEEMTILLEHGDYITTALITEENLATLRNKLIQLVRDIEDFYKEEFETFNGDVEIFSKIGKFIQRLFEN